LLYTAKLIFEMHLTSKGTDEMDWLRLVDCMAQW